MIANVERADDGRSRRDVGADQERAGGLDRDLDHQRQAPAGGGHRGPGAVDRGLGLERILAGLAEDDVGATRDQARGLDAERLLEGPVGDVAERGQAGAGADRADDEALAAVACDLRDRLVGELGRAPVDLERPLAEVELAERDRRAAEAVGLERIGTGLEIAQVDLPDQIGAAQVQDLGAVLLIPEVGLDREIATLDLGPHGPIDQKDPALEGLEKCGCHRDQPQAAWARRGCRPSSRQASRVSSARFRV